MSGAASEQLGNNVNMHKMSEGVWGNALPGKFWNLHALRLNLKPSGGQVLPSVKLSNLLVLEQSSRIMYVSVCDYA